MRQLDDAERAAIAQPAAAAAGRPAIRDAVVGRLRTSCWATSSTSCSAIRLPRAGARAADPGLGGGRRPAALRAATARGRRPAGAARGPHRGRRRSRDLAPTGTLGSARRSTPWPAATSPEEDDALRVSSELAAADAAAAVDRALSGTGSTGSRTVPGRGGPRRGSPICSCSATHSRSAAFDASRRAVARRPDRPTHAVGRRHPRPVNPNRRSAPRARGLCDARAVEPSAVIAILLAVTTLVTYGRGRSSRHRPDRRPGDRGTAPGRGGRARPRPCPPDRRG